MGRRKNYIDDASVSLDINFSDSNIRIINERFTVKKTSIMTYSQIANMFHFNKELINSKLYQLDMLPVVAYFENGEPTTHDKKCVPYGAIIPKTATWEFIDGEEYLVADTALWTGRYKELDNIGLANQSMEIVGIRGEYKKEDKFYDVSDFNFDALCVLNQEINPAFKKARMDIGDLSKEMNNESFSDDFETFKAEFAQVLKNIIQEDISQEKGSVNVEETIQPITEIVELIVEPVAEIIVEETPTEEVVSTDVVESTEMAKTEEEIPEDEKEKITEEVIDDEKKVDYQELYTAVQKSFDELAIKYSELESEIIPLKQFKLESEQKEINAKAEMELEEKNKLIESFSKKLSKKSIDTIIDDVTKFSLDEIKAKLSIELANQILSNNEDKGEFSDVVVNIDSMIKTVNREDRLLAEMDKYNQ